MSLLTIEDLNDLSKSISCNADFVLNLLKSNILVNVTYVIEELFLLVAACSLWYLSFSSLAWVKKEGQLWHMCHSAKFCNRWYEIRLKWCVCVRALSKTSNLLLHDISC